MVLELKLSVSHKLGRVLYGRAIASPFSTSDFYCHFLGIWMCMCVCPFLYVPMYVCVCACGGQGITLGIVIHAPSTSLILAFRQGT